MKYGGIDVSEWEYNNRWDTEEGYLIEWYKNQRTGQCYDSTCDKLEYAEIFKHKELIK